VALLPALDGGLTVAGHEAAGTTGTMIVDLQSEVFYSRRVMILRAVGAFLILLGVAEFVVFRFLAPSKANIARRLGLLTLNSAVNVIVGVVLIALSL
jgi:hypothetical protein